MPPRALLPRSAPAASGVSSRAISALLDMLDEKSIECHSLMVVRHGHVVAEGWWAPYSAERPHLLYSLTKSFTSIAVGLAIADGLLSLDDRVVDVLPDHVPSDISEQGRRINVHHLPSMTAGHRADTLAEAWQLEPGDLVKGFLRVPFTTTEGTRHTYDNSTTFILARMVERVVGRGLPVIVGPADGGWRIQIESLPEIQVGRGEWRESSPLGRPVCASGAWQDAMFVADLYIITTPHHVRLAVDANAGTAGATWSTVPLTSPNLALHLRSPLMTRPDVA